MPTVQHFITEDEIDAAMTGGSSFAGGKGRIYAFFMENHTDKELSLIHIYHQKIAIRQGMSEVQTVSATVHEIAHSKLCLLYTSRCV